MSGASLRHACRLGGRAVVAVGSAGLAAFYGGVVLVFAVATLAAVVNALSGSRQLLTDLGGSTLDSASTAGTSLTTVEAIGAAWILLAACIVAALGVAVPRMIARAVGRPAGERRALRLPSRRIAAGMAVAVVALWVVRPVVHPLLMLFYEYPLVTWIPVLIGAAAAFAVARWERAHRREPSLTVPVGAGVAALAWIVFMLMLPSWQGRALYDASVYTADGALPFSTQPRLLPKAAVRAYGGQDDLQHAHLVVDPVGGGLVWSAEHKAGPVPRGPSDAIATLPLDRTDGSFARRSPGFDPAVSDVGPGSLPWRAYGRHYFTRVQDPVIVPLGDGRAVAVAPYIGYRGFPVRHPYWQGVYVYHQDGTLEDLSPQQALARPELARSGRLFPETLARDVAKAYGYKTGSAAALLDRPRTDVDQPKGNPQPYLTNLGDRRVSWVTVAHPAGDDATASAVFLTDAATGATAVWQAPPGERVLSNEGAAALARKLPLEWRECCDDNGNDLDIRAVTEARPVFSQGRFYYLVSIVPVNGFRTSQPVDRTVLIDAQERRVVRVFDHADPGADAALRAFFRRGRAAFMLH